LRIGFSIVTCGIDLATPSNGIACGSILGYALFSLPLSQDANTSEVRQKAEGAKIPGRGGGPNLRPSAAKTGVGTPR